MAEPAPAFELTPQEREILRLVRQGYRDREIAGNLSLPVLTVASTLRQICEKMNVKDRLELAMLAARFQL